MTYLYAQLCAAKKQLNLNRCEYNCDDKNQVDILKTSYNQVETR